MAGFPRFSGSATEKTPAAGAGGGSLRAARRPACCLILVQLPDSCAIARFLCNCPILVQLPRVPARVACFLCNYDTACLDFRQKRAFDCQRHARGSAGDRNLGLVGGVPVEPGLALLRLRFSAEQPAWASLAAAEAAAETAEGCGVRRRDSGCGGDCGGLWGAARGR